MSNYPLIFRVRQTFQGPTLPIEQIPATVNAELSRLKLGERIKPGSHMDAVGPYLPAKYSPLTPSGSGLQSVYLTHVPPGLADALIALIGSEATHARRMADS